MDQTNISLIVGDYNINFLSNSNTVMELLSMMESAKYKAIFKEITRPSHHGGTCIDNVFINHEHRIISKEVVPVSFSDHHAQIVKIKIPEKVRCINYRQKCRRINLNTLSELSYLLSQENWNSMYQIDDPEAAYNDFISTFLHHYNVACPTYDKRIRPKKQKFQLTEEVQQQGTHLTVLKHAQKNNLYDGEVLKEEIKKCKNRLRRAHNEAVKVYNTNKIREAGNVTKETWNIIKQHKSSIVPRVNQITLEVQGKPCSNPDLVANVLNDYYVNVPVEIYNKIGNTPFDFTNLKKVNNSIFMQKTNPEEV